jgi:hypothetical protein
MKPNVLRGSARPFASSVPPTREEVRARARELAAIAGRAPHEVAQGDYEQAKREVTGESDQELQEAMLVDNSSRD